MSETTLNEVGLVARLRDQLGDLNLDVQLALPKRGVSALFGRSGCGKTSILRRLAGLERSQHGVIHFNGEVWQDEQTFVPAHQRGIGYVFQEASLFPHLNLRQNLEYGYRRTPLAKRRVEFDAAVQWLGLQALLQARPQQLSGGQRQRAAIARALLTSPRLLLMDEPLSSLDQQSKADILPYLERLFSSLEMPVVFVSHAPTEVMRLAQHLVLLDQGRVQAAGALNPMLTRPDLSLAHLDEASAVLEARVDEHDLHYHLSYLRIADGRLALSLKDLPIGYRTRVRILARDVSLALTPPQHSSISNLLAVSLVDVHSDMDPAQVLVRLRLSGGDDEQLLLARITRRSADQLQLQPGLALYAQVKSVALME